MTKVLRLVSLIITIYFVTWASGDVQHSKQISPLNSSVNADLMTRKKVRPWWDWHVWIAACQFLSNHISRLHPPLTHQPECPSCLTARQTLSVTACCISPVSPLNLAPLEELPHPHTYNQMSQSLQSANHLCHESSHKSAGTWASKRKLNSKLNICQKMTCWLSMFTAAWWLTAPPGELRLFRFTFVSSPVRAFSHILHFCSSLEGFSVNSVCWCVDAWHCKIWMTQSTTQDSLQDTHRSY